MDNLYVQMYSFMDGGEYDSKKNLKVAAEIGFVGAELFGPNFEIPAEEMKTYLEELGLKPISLHAPNTDAVVGLIPYAETLGMHFIGIGMETFSDEEAAHAFAHRLNEIGEKCHAHGLTLTYHNHTHEFAVYSGKTVWDILLEETNPEFVAFELDAGWCAAAGVDPMEIVQKYSGRIQLIHIKESDRVIGSEEPMGAGEVEKDEDGKPIFTQEQLDAFAAKKQLNCLAGAGLVDWTALKTIADQHGCQTYIVEREMTLHETRVETLQADYQYYSANC